ncbi:MAG: YgiT-type zinc finger protein [Pseudoramibacter sp.]
MLCTRCGGNATKTTTTDVTDLGYCLVIIRNVPCYQCDDCDEIIYTGDVVKKIEKIINSAKKLMQEISVVDYKKIA